MKTLIKILIIFIIWSLSFVVRGQTETKLALDRIKPLEELLRLAEQNVTSLRALNSSQQIFMEQGKITKKSWLQHISANAKMNYGNGIIFDDILSTNDQTLRYLTRQNVTYNIGINIRLPITAVVSRRNEIKINQLEIERLEGEKQEQRDYIRNEVIRVYSELKAILKVLKIKAEVIEANDIAMKLNENYFKVGNLEFEKYRKALNVTYSDKLEYETAKNQAWYILKVLRELVGEEILK